MNSEPVPPQHLVEEKHWILFQRLQFAEANAFDNQTKGRRKSRTVSLACWCLLALALREFGGQTVIILPMEK